MKRHGICKIALAVFFLLNALSPFAYDLSARSITYDLSRETYDRSFRNASLYYLIEVLYEAIFGPHKPENESSPNRVLIRKKSALQRGRYDVVMQSGRSAAFAAKALTAHRHFSIERKRVEIIRPRLRKNGRRLPLSSGLSPPLLS